MLAYCIVSLINSGRDTYAGSEFPNLEVITNKGTIKVTDYFAGSWGILFSHPNDYTPVCTTELGEAAIRSGDFDRRNVKLLGLSCNSAADHDGWAKDIGALKGKEVGNGSSGIPKYYIAFDMDFNCTRSRLFTLIP